MEMMLVMNLCTGLVLAGLSIPLILGKVKPNGWYGFRVKTTMEDPAVWYAVNTYAGGWLLVTALVIELSAIGLYLIPGIRLDTYSLACLAVFGTVLAVGMVQSSAYARRLK